MTDLGWDFFFAPVVVREDVLPVKHSRGMSKAMGIATFPMSIRDNASEWPGIRLC